MNGSGTIRRTILHLDMDAFFAAVEALDNPALKGVPLVVGSAPDKRGVVATCSYEARKFGVRSAMPSRTAYQLCPQAVFVPPRPERYAEISRRVMAILESVTPEVEPVSIDEAFLDITGVLKRWPSAEAVARHLKARIREELGLSASVGVAPNKFLAKLASDLNKPDGLTVAPFEPDAIRDFLKPLPIGRIWGVGKVTEAELHRFGIRTIGDVQARTEADLARMLGSAGAGAHVWRLARGEDDRVVESGDIAEKSISNETTFPEDCADSATQRQTLLELAEQVGRRLRSAGKLAGTVQVKVRFADFRTITRQCPLRPPGDGDAELIRLAFALFDREGVSRPVRLLGFGVAGLADAREAADGETDGPVQPSLFPDEAAVEEERRCADSAREREARARLDRTVDELRRKFGTEILRRGRWCRDDG
jgi:DNA polymerase-4